MKLLTIAEVAIRLQVSRAWVSDHASGKRRPVLPSVKLGKCVRFEEDQIAEFLRECRRIGKRSIISLQQ